MPLRESTKLPARVVLLKLNELTISPPLRRRALYSGLYHELVSVVIGCALRMLLGELPSTTIANVLGSTAVPLL